MDFDISFNLLGLIWPFDVSINKREDDLVAEAIRCSDGSKILAIKTLRGFWPEFLGLREAKDMIEDQWNY